MEELWTSVVALFHTALDALPAFNPNSAVWPSVTGSLIGAITGGMITYLVQRTIAGWARRQRAIEREDNNLVIAISLALKALKIYSNISSIKEVIGEQKRQATQRYPNAQFDWTHLRLFGLVSFSAPTERREIRSCNSSSRCVLRTHPHFKGSTRGYATPVSI